MLFKDYYYFKNYDQLRVSRFQNNHRILIYIEDCEQSYQNNRTNGYI